MGRGAQLMERALEGVARRWIAGRTADDALASAAAALAAGRGAIVNRLGEYHDDPAEAAEAAADYRRLAAEMGARGLRAALSVKPTQVGLSVGLRECASALAGIVDAARERHVFVWVDMESSEHTDDTISLYHRAFARYERVGVALQANLRRTEADLRDLAGRGAKVRLVKGAYREGPREAFTSRADVDASYSRLMGLLFREADEFGIATHDARMIAGARRLNGLRPRRFDFQMLKGIGEGAKPGLIREGLAVTDYIPYGRDWLAYSARRIRERRRNLLLLGSSLLQRQRV